MDFTAKPDHAGLLEHLRRRLFVLAIPPQVETFRFGIGKNVVIFVVEIWEFNSSALLNDQRPGAN
jgi:hypothetical protein